jgi:PAS domain S-box-containing protein
LALVLPFVSQTVGTVALVGYLSYQSGQQATENLANQLLQQTSERIIDRLNSYLHTPQQIVAANRLAVEQGTLNLTNPEQVRRQLWQQILLNPALTANGFWSEAGNAISYLRISSDDIRTRSEKVSGQTIPLNAVLFNEIKPNQRRYFRTDAQGKPSKLVYQLNDDFRTIPWYRQAKRMRKPGWTSISLSRVIPVLQIFAITPVADTAGNLQGFFTANYVLSEISRFLNQLRFSATGQVFILERSGDLVATSIPSEAAGLRQINGKPVRLSAFNSQDQRTREIAQQLIQQFGHLDSLKRTRQLSLMVAGQRQFVQVTPYQNQDGLNWQVVLVIPESDFMAEIQQNKQNTGWLCLLALGVAIASGLTIAHRVSGRIAQMERASQQLATGDLTQQLPTDSSIVEVQGLATSFNRMAEQLRQLFQRQVEAEATRQSEARFQQLAAAVPGMIYTYTQYPNGSHGFEYVSSFSQTILELEPEQIIADVNAALDQIHLDDRPSHHAAVIHSTQTLEPFTFAFRNITPSGQLKWLEASSRPLRHQDGTLTWYGILLDVSAHKQLEQALRRSEAKIRAILDSTIAAIASFRIFQDGDWQVDHVSAGCELLSGYSSEELTQHKDLWINRIEPADWQPIVAQVFANIFAEQTATYEYRFHCQDGSLRWISQTNNSCWDETQQCWVVTAVSVDITDRKRVEQELQLAKEAAEAANQAKSTFLANMSHELRTPLNAILGFAQLMQRHSLPSDDRIYLQLIQTNGQHLLKLINEVLDLAKVEAGEITLEHQTIDLFSQLRSIRDTLSDSCDRKRLQFHLEILPGVPQYIVTDSQKLYQVLLNLLSNAIKFTDVGSVTLRVEVVEPTELLSSLTDAEVDRESVISLLFQVKDTGIGIAAPELGQIFEAFRQTAAGQAAQEGTGLGLTISRRLVQFMGGELTVDSVLGQGTTFQFTLPMVAAITAPSLASGRDRLIAGLVPHQPQYHILAVDDQLENRLLLVKLFEQLGLPVHQAATGEEAIALWQQWQPQLIWMDVRLPGLNGYETTRQIRALERDRKLHSVIIALTAQALPGDRTLALAAGCDDYISKPFRAEILFQKMAEHLGTQFIYADDRQVSSDMNQSLVSLPLIAEDLAVMPRQWMAKLYQAAVRCQDEVVRQLIQQIPQEYAALAQELEKLTYDFKFEVMMDLTKVYADSE